VSALLTKQTKIATERKVKVRKYIAKDIHEALREVKSDLGPEAVILQTKPCQIKRFFGLIRKEGVEVTAGIGMNFLSDLVSKPAAKETPAAEIPAAEAQTETPKPDDVLERRMESLEKTLTALQESVTKIAEVKDVSPAAIYPPEVEKIAERLRDNGVEDEYVKELLLTYEGAGDSVDCEALTQGLTEKIAGNLRCTGTLPLPPDAPKVIALVGPTGVGKTTTLAKISASYCLNQERKVAMITTDTYRLAATDQLKRYADILALPLDVVYSAEEMRDAVQKRQDCDLIFVDTAGRSQKNATHMAELQVFLEAALPAQVHLLLSATTKYEDLLELVEKFELVPLDSLVVTKLDESNSFGAVFNLLRKVDLPVSYLTTGQNVPEDIELAKPERLAKILLTSG